MKKTFRQCAIDYIQNRHLCKGYVDYIVAQLNKLDKIEQIVEDSGNFKGERTAYDKYIKIAEIILEKE